MKTLEVCLIPSLFDYGPAGEEYIVVVIDVLRATTSFCAAFDNGVASIIPIAGLEIARQYKESGYMVVAERGGKKVDFADFANSPIELLNAPLKGAVLVYTTTNGTKAIEKAKAAGELAIGCFSNIKVLCDWLTTQNKNVLFLCSGWENTVSLEDTVCAGAMVYSLLDTGKFYIEGDSAQVAVSLFTSAKKDLFGYLSNASHFQRLEKLGCQNDLVYCMQMNISDSLPVWNGKELVNVYHKPEYR